MRLHPLCARPPRSFLQNERSGTQGSWGRWGVCHWAVLACGHPRAPGLVRGRSALPPSSLRDADLALEARRLQHRWEGPGAPSRPSALSQHTPWEAASLGRKDAPLSAPLASLAHLSLSRLHWFLGSVTLSPSPRHRTFLSPSSGRQPGTGGELS